MRRALDHLLIPAALGAATLAVVAAGVAELARAFERAAYEWEGFDAE